MTRTSNPQYIWQWNCRGFRTKRANLQAHIASIPNPPILIALQETYHSPKLKDSASHSPSDFPQIATLVHRNIATQHVTFASPIPHILTTLHLPKSPVTRLHVLNIYSPPKSKHISFKYIFQQALAFTKRDPLLIVGDFNAPNIEWGYSYTTRKGRLLSELTHSLNLTLHTDPSSPTRIGNSAQRDTTPDLTFSTGQLTHHTSTTSHTFGSDNYIISTCLTL